MRSLDERGDELRAAVRTTPRHILEIVCEDTRYL